MSKRAVDRKARWGQLLVCASLVSTNCALSSLSDGQPDDESGFSIGTLRPPNLPIDGNNKTGARVVCDQAALLYSPGGEPIAGRTLERERLVLVQQAPGAVRGPDGQEYLWTDDLNGAKDEFQSHFGKSTTWERYWAGRPARIKYRGWVRKSCLESAEVKSDRAGLPSTDNPNPAGNGAIFPNGSGVAVAYRVKAACGIPETLKYKNSSASDDPDDEEWTSSYVSYGSSRVPKQDALYILFNTPGACSDASSYTRCFTSRGGGGMTAGYLRAGSEFFAHWSFNDPNASDVPQARWHYGYGAINGLAPGQRGTWGWVWAGCLEKVVSTTPGAPQPPEPQGANLPGAPPSVPNAPPPQPPPAAPQMQPGTCRVRCCDNSLFTISTADAAVCRQQYGVCADRGKVARMKFQPAGSSIEHPVYDRGGC